MCRSIKRLRRPDTAPTEEELRAAALQFVRKVSGFQKPSRANREAFESAVQEIAHATGVMLDSMAARRLPDGIAKRD